MPRRSLIALCVLMTACAATGSAPSADAPALEASPEWAVGQIRVVGSMPVDVTTVLVEPSGQRTEIRGPLRTELRSLSGAEVAVYGTRSGGLIEATDYEIRRIDGAPVLVGVVEEGPEGTLQIRTRRGEVFEIAGSTGTIEVGQRVWIQGRASIQVQSFGVIPR